MKTLCGSYRDVVSCGTGVELVIDGPKYETRDRLAWYCVSPPGEAAWVGSGPVQEDRGGGGWTQWNQNQ